MTTKGDSRGSNLLIGSQEWRFVPNAGEYPMWPYEFYLATRCGLRAVGAGLVTHAFIPNKMWYAGYKWYRTRADAAAAAWKQYADGEHMKKISMRDLELTEFWHEAYRVVR